MGRPQVPDWAPQFRWSAGLSHPRWLACWSPSSSGQQAPVGAGVRLSEVEPMLLRRPARLPGGAVTATAAWPGAAPSPPSLPGCTVAPQRLDVGEGRWSLPRSGFLRPRTGPAGVGPRCLAPASVQARSALGGLQPLSGGLGPERGVPGIPCRAGRISAILRAFHPTAVPQGRLRLRSDQVTLVVVLEL